MHVARWATLALPIGLASALLAGAGASATTLLPQSTAKAAEVSLRVPLEITHLPRPHDLKVSCEVQAPVARQRVPDTYRIELPLTIPAEGTLHGELVFHFDLPEDASSAANARCVMLTAQGTAVCAADSAYRSAVAANGACTDSVTAPLAQAGEAAPGSATPAGPVLGTPVEAPVGTVLTADAPVTQYGLLGEAHADPTPRRYLLDLKRMTINNVTTALDDNYETGGDEPWVMVIRLQGRIGDATNPGAVLFLDDSGWGKVGPENWGTKGASRSLTAPWAQQPFGGVRPYEFAGAMLVVLEADGMPNAEREKMVATIGESVQAAWRQALSLRLDLDYSDTTPSHATTVVTRLADVHPQVRANLNRAVADGVKRYVASVVQRVGTAGFVPFVPDQVMDARLVMTLNPAGLPAETIGQLFAGAIVPTGTGWHQAKFSIEAEQARNADDGLMSPVPERGAHWSIDYTVEDAATP